MYGFALVDEFDLILRRLSVDYLQEAWERLYLSLRSQGLRDLGSRFRYGRLHPGVAVLDPPGGRDAYDSPLAYFGWMSPEAEPDPETEALYGAAGALLVRQSPRLQWGISYRSEVLDLGPGDFAAGLEACLQSGEWLPHTIASAGRPDEPWRLAARSLVERRPDRYQAALLQAEVVYSPDGFRMLKQGLEPFARHPEWFE